MADEIKRHGKIWWNGVEITDIWMGIQTISVRDGLDNPPAIVSMGDTYLKDIYLPFQSQPYGPGIKFQAMTPGTNTYTIRNAWKNDITLYNYSNGEMAQVTGSADGEPYSYGYMDASEGDTIGITNVNNSSLQQWVMPPVSDADALVPFISGGDYVITEISDMSSFTTDASGSMLPAYAFAYFFANDGGHMVGDLPDGSFDLSGCTTAGNGAFIGFNQNGTLTSLPSGSFDTFNITVCGDDFFRSFNDGGTLTELPYNSFRITYINTAGSGFFQSFNENGDIIHLPADSFSFPNILAAGDGFFSRFNMYGDIVVLPDDSFTTNMTVAGDNFFYGFNNDGSITELPDGSFNLLPLTQVGDNFMAFFNQKGAITGLPLGSFDTSQISTVGIGYMRGFNGVSDDTKGGLKVYTLYRTNTVNVASYDVDVYYADAQPKTVSSNENFDFGTSGEPPIPPETGRIVLTAIDSGIRQVSNKWNTSINVLNSTTGIFMVVPPNTTMPLSAGAGNEIIIWETEEDGFKSFSNYLPGLISGANVELSEIPAMEYFMTTPLIAPDLFFYGFNYGGSITKLPEGSFDTSGIVEVGDSFFQNFNANGGRIRSLPLNSFDTSAITTYGVNFMDSFNNGGNIKRSTIYNTNTINVTQDMIVASYSDGTTGDIYTDGNFNFAYDVDPIHFTFKANADGNAVIYNHWTTPITVYNVSAGEERVVAGGGSTSIPVPANGTFRIEENLSMDTFNQWTQIAYPLVSGVSVQMTEMPDFVYFTDDRDGFELADYAFYYFNSEGTITSLPEGSFQTDDITIIGSHCFENFNYRGTLTALPSGSFNLDFLESIGEAGFKLFNSYGNLTSLPDGSLSLSMLDTLPDEFAYGFNLAGDLTCLSFGSFDTNNITSWGNNALSAFNGISSDDKGNIQRTFYYSTNTINRSEENITVVYSNGVSVEVEPGQNLGFIVCDAPSGPDFRISTSYAFDELNRSISFQINVFDEDIFRTGAAINLKMSYDSEFTDYRLQQSPTRNLTYTLPYPIPGRVLYVQAYGSLNGLETVKTSLQIEIPRPVWGIVSDENGNVSVIRDMVVCKPNGNVTQRNWVDQSIDNGFHGADRIVAK